MEEIIVWLYPNENELTPIIKNWFRRGREELIEKNHGVKERDRSTRQAHTEIKYITSPWRAKGW
jgi:hypothetical protein